MDIVGLVAVVMVFSVPLTAIMTTHFRKQTQSKHQIIDKQLELEKLKHENYMLETEKLRLELDLRQGIKMEDDYKRLS
ncbi:hypothetical protein KP77_00650 [Jeotgalibacillus alimentarius]|uniref:Uncharacterized protein n=1 Tax=Jeotgalibacillus alimentarius TaxID=135826 RepID=A0A0C2VY02_9BACL|nr:hypothetical protein [Jeotgalibacillus alimentarius]KIL53722.1 hypothetical protein KP77_00650 [Jeotgalibacillus alimentarius]